jgi:transposase
MLAGEDTLLYLRPMKETRLVCHTCQELQAEIVGLNERIAALENALNQRDELIISLQACITTQDKENQELKTSIHNLKKEAFGSKSESKRKLNRPGSGNKNNKKRKTANRKGSRTIPAGIPREKVVLSLPDSERICSRCGEVLQVIGNKVSEKIDIIQAMLRAIRYEREQYACPKCKCKESMKLAPLPEHNCNNLFATPNLLAWIINSKYNYHIPLHRMSKMFTEQGFNISDKTLDSWVLNTAPYLEPLLAKAVDQLLASQHVFSDDTTGRLLVSGQKKTATSRLWVYMTKSEPKIVVYDFTLTREGKHPQQFLHTFRGYLQTDAYKGYYALYQDEQGNVLVIPVYCMAHCRRKFFTIAEKTTISGLADVALEYIGKLYEIEDEIKLSTAEDTFNYRQEFSVPVLNEFHNWLDNTRTIIMPKTELSMAINYAWNHWVELSNYCLDGNLDIDNNRSERKMRGPKLGQNNYLFFGSERGGKAAAIFYSFIESCKENEISPMAWLADVIPKLYYYKMSQIEDLLPHNWVKKLAHTNSVAA